VGYLAVDLEPPGNVAGEVGARRPVRRPGRDRANPRLPRQASRDHAQRAEARRGQLEDRRRIGRHVMIDRAELMADVAPRVVWESTGGPRAIEPAQTRQPDRAGETAHEKGRVRRAGDRWKARRDRVQRALAAKSRERGQRVGRERGIERIRARSIGEQYDDRHRSWWLKDSGTSPLG